MKVYAVIPAGGKGKRGGTETPKQYIRFHGKELIVYTLEVFQQNNLVDEIIISAEPAYFSLLEEIKNKFHLTKITKIVEGGEERQDSVNSALKSINADDNDLIAVHDAARPLLPESILTKAINTAKDKGNALVCL
ncbi:MAG: 2-C-methyl-D-erythritol 4-phosphate cytidylyltransferase, partial [Ignavibacteriaceae bacterium]|nr:2-C-methyl-D-erythritol 4-phosphate cytidylyltransferase [Ignavibacteriaceae bacterium]